MHTESMSYSSSSNFNPINRHIYMLTFRKKQNEQIKNKQNQKNTNANTHTQQNEKQQKPENNHQNPQTHKYPPQCYRKVKSLCELTEVQKES